MKYEYKVISKKFITLTELNEQGDEGWILCYVSPPDNNSIKQYVFYRKKENVVNINEES